jgi:hypothetical protein
MVVTISGATGLNKDNVNGTYTRVLGEYLNGDPVFHRRMEITNEVDRQHLDLWCRSAPSGDWFVSGLAQKKANQAAGWCASQTTGARHPGLVSGWLVWSGTAYEFQPLVVVSFAHRRFMRYSRAHAGKHRVWCNNNSVWCKQQGVVQTTVFGANNGVWCKQQGLVQTPGCGATLGG